MPDEPSRTQEKARLSLVFWLIGSAALPVLFFSGLFLAFQQTIMTQLATSQAVRMLCDDIQNIRTGVIDQLGEETFDRTIVERLLLKSGSGAASDLRWGMRVGDFFYSNLDAGAAIVGARYGAIPDVPEGTEYLDRYRIKGGKSYIGCSQIYDISSARFGARYSKAIYTVAWPIADFEDTVEKLNGALDDPRFRSSYVFILIFWTFLLLALTLIVVQIIIFRPAIKALEANIEKVLQGDADRLPGRYPREIHPIVSIFNDVIKKNEAALDYTRGIVMKIAHDLNNKLQSLLSAVEAADIDRKLVRRHIAGLKSQIDRYRQIAMSSQGDGRAQFNTRSFDLVTFVEETLWVQRIDLINSRNEYRLRVNGVLLEAGGAEAANRPEIRVLGHKGDLEIMLANLLSNASKYGRGLIEVGIAVSGEDVSITVDDNGPGIPAADRSRVFDAGTMLNPDQKLPGTGFGLDIVAGIARMSGGTATVDDGDLGGARFKLVLPIHRPAASGGR